MARDPALDQVLSSSMYDIKAYITLTASGTWLNVTVVADYAAYSDFATITITPSGESVESLHIIVTQANLTLSGNEVIVTLGMINIGWIKWSNIGSLDFTIGRDNVAGARPSNYSGTIYAIKKLGNKMVVYADNEVSLLTPASHAFSLDTIYRVGLKGAGAVAGDNSKHYFIDKLSQLWLVSEGLTKLNFSEYLSVLGTNLNMFYDYMNNLIYIADGTNGFIYNTVDNSLGRGYSNISGLLYGSGSLTVVAPETISMPNFRICTDIYDFGTRKFKTLTSFELGTDCTKQIYLAVDYRIENNQAFKTTQYAVVGLNGIAYVPCYGVEFRVRIKTMAYAYLELDYVKIYGTIHSHSRLDYADWRSI